MDEHIKYKLAGYLGMIMIVLGSAGLGFFVSQAYNSHREIASLSFSEYPSGCKNLGLEETADCLRNELSEFYFFNDSNTGKNLTLAQLKQEGGVCTHFSRWYTQRFKEIGGFYTKEVSIDLTPEDAHRFVVASYNTTYCIIDQLAPPYCQELKF